MKRLTILIAFTVLSTGTAQAQQQPLPSPPVPPGLPAPAAAQNTQGQPAALPSGPSLDMPLPPPNPLLEGQMQGSFPALSTPNGLPLGATQDAWNAAPAEAGVYRFAWTPHVTGRVTLRTAMPAVFTLPSGDAISEVVVGDQNHFKYRLAENHSDKLFAWTTTAGADTSLHIIGESERVYSFILRSEDHRSPNLSSVRVFIETQDPGFENAVATSEPTAVPVPMPANQTQTANAGQSLAPEINDPEDPRQNAEWVRAIAFNPSDVRFDREMSGDAEIAPVRVFRDEQFTYLWYGTRADSIRWPNVQKQIDGVDNPVNFRSEGEYLIVESIETLTLSHGDKTVCIYPVELDTSSASTTRTSSGSPTERPRRELRPGGDS